MRKRAEPFLDTFGEGTMQKVFSKTWSLREQGLKEIEQEVNRGGGSSSTKSALLSAILGITSYTVPDKIAQVAQRALGLLNTTLDRLSGASLTSDGH